MENTITSTGQKIAEAGVLASFMFFVIIGLGWFVMKLYQRNQDIGDKMHAALTDNAIALEKLTASIRRDA